MYTCIADAANQLDGFDELLFKRAVVTRLFYKVAGAECGTFGKHVEAIGSRTWQSEAGEMQAGFLQFFFRHRQIAAAGLDAVFEARLVECSDNLCGIGTLEIRIKHREIAVSGP